ncbi:helix-turn-helix domain-containing protein [Salmonella enterica]|nr:helix-turn-helix domain-containing protein [Salmonella enterica]
MNKISTYRKQLGLSQRQFANHLGWIHISPQALRGLFRRKLNSVRNAVMMMR